MDRTALVTGASSGIGKATAAALAARGYRVLGTSRRPEALGAEQRADGVDYRPLDLGDDASKAGLTGFSDGARHEYSPFGVWLTTIEPGAINTGIGERRTTYVAEGSPHRADFERMLAALDRNAAAGVPAERVAATILKAI